jgi:hypothetical protein
MKRMMLVGCVWTTAWFTAGCGGSSSETPFPQAPIETGLEQRHEVVFTAEHPVDTPAATSLSTASVSRATPVDGNAASEGAATGGSAANGVAAPAGDTAKTDLSK